MDGYNAVYSEKKREIHLTMGQDRNKIMYSKYIKMNSFEKE